MAETADGYMRCALKVDTSSKGWHKTMIKILNSIRGLKYSIDAEAGIAYVAGTIHPETLLRLLAKSGKHATLIRVDSGHRDHFPPERISSSSSSYGYSRNSTNYEDDYDHRGRSSSYQLIPSTRDHYNPISSTAPPQYKALDYQTSNPQYKALDYQPSKPPYKALDYQPSKPPYKALDYQPSNRFYDPDTSCTIM